MDIWNRANRLPLTGKNWTVLLLGLLVIVMGYVFLAIPPAEGFWSLTLGPIFLVVGYCILIPVGILIGRKQKGR